jgi:hypothetical protein
VKTRDSARIAGLRLLSQRIIPTPGRESDAAPTPADAVGWMLAMQGQDLPGVKWSAALRAPGSTAADVDRALENGELVRSWPLRGTLHLVGARDLGWILALTAERSIQGVATRHRQLGLDPDTFAKAAGVASGALTGGGRLSRDGLFAEFEAHGISTDGQRGAHLLWYLSVSGLVCLGPPEGTGQAVVLLDEWVPDPHRPARSEAFGELARRYFSSHGPATLKDFLWWGKLLVPDAKAGLLAARDSLRELVIDGTSYWLAADAPDSAPRGTLALLPGFDEYLLGYQDRSAVLPDEHSDRIVPGGNGMFLSTIVSNGRVVGLWKRRTTASGIELTPEPFAELSAAETTRLHRAARAYARYLGAPLRRMHQPAQSLPLAAALR